MAAELMTVDKMATMIHYTSGVICVAMLDKRMQELNLPPMVSQNQDPKQTAFGISVDATPAHGISTGTSSHDRTKTVKLLVDQQSKAVDFTRPGHLFPLRANDGGVLVRNGHTEAAIDLVKLAGLEPCGVLSEIVSQKNKGEMAKLDELLEFAEIHNYVITSIADLQDYLK